MNIEIAIKKACKELKKNKISSALLDSELLLSKVIKKDREFILLNLDKELDQNDQDNFKDLILHAEIRTPHEIEKEVGLTEGNIFQGELTLDQLMFNRPFPGYAQYRGPFKKMYM